MQPDSEMVYLIRLKGAEGITTATVAIFGKTAKTAGKTVGKAIPYVGTVLTVMDLAYKGYKIYKEMSSDGKNGVNKR